MKKCSYCLTMETVLDVSVCGVKSLAETLTDVYVREAGSSSSVSSANVLIVSVLMSVFLFEH